ncbi:MAG TPA: DNA polymerase III subunit delta [Phycisphaerae bacterium]|nr:DNA polymerase III subunit delta [Phycisphaerae bacterium]
MTSPPPKCVYVLHGDETFLVDASRKEITDLVVGDADRQLCISSFDDSAELADVLDEVRTLPFLAPRRLVIVREADAFVSAHRAALEKFLQSPPASATLMLTVRSWPSNTRLAKIVAKIGQAIDCSLPKHDSLRRWLADAAARRGKRIAPDAAELMAQWVGRDLAALDAEMEKLSLYVGERTDVTVQDVSVLVTSSAGPAAFELTNAITDGNARAALEALSGMLQTRGDEFKTLGMIAWHLRRATMAKESLLAGLGERQAVPNMPPGPARAFLAMLKRRPLSAFHEDFRRLIRADLAMKSGTRPPAALQELVVGLCS